MYGELIGQNYLKFRVIQSILSYFRDVSLAHNVKFWPQKLTRYVSIWGFGFLGQEPDP